MALSAALLGRGGVAFARPGPIHWSDVPLIDGTVLPASALERRTVVVEFWASWCPFCAKQNPSIEKLYQARSDGLRVLTFSIDRSEQAVRDYMKRHGYTFPAAMAGGQSDRWFGPRHGLPVVHVVDAGGRIVFSESGEMFEEDIAGLTRFAAQ
ncbi:MAG TPA: TlpA disulfide reductase family protein [Burkholderiaceae bacterium]|nr:TlpA disulfide reductase family protein [Burkholderiaceae bacterium]